MRVWGIYHKVKANGMWCRNWTGPCGIYGMSFRDKLGDVADIVAGRPFFFRTRKQARDEVKKQEERSNQTRIWVKHKVAPFELETLSYCFCF